MLSYVEIAQRLRMNRVKYDRHPSSVLHPREKGHQLVASFTSVQSFNV